MTVLELQHITKLFDGFRVIDDLSLSFEQGKITSLVGPNGAGKTTLFNLISGLLRPEHGKIFYQEILLNNLTPWQRAQRGIGRLWQDVRVFEKLTTLENVLLARKNNPGEGIVSNLIRLSTVTRFERESIEQARHFLDLVGLSGKEHTLASDLSYGQQKLLALARLLANDAQLLLLDEPTSGIHPHLIRTILEVIQKIAQDRKTVIIIEHNFGIVFEISDWVYLMDKGRIELAGIPEEVAQIPLLKEVYLGI